MIPFENKAWLLTLTTTNIQENLSIFMSPKLSAVCLRHKNIVENYLLDIWLKNEFTREELSHGKKKWSFSKRRLFPMQFSTQTSYKSIRFYTYCLKYVSISRL